MASSFDGYMLDSSKCSNMSMEEKRELVHEISKWPQGACEILQSWSRHDILQILCAEMGKERKYTGLTKLKIIENLLKIVSEKKMVDHEVLAEAEQPPTPADASRAVKRQRKIDNPSRISNVPSTTATNNCDDDTGTIIYCRNSACKAIMKEEDAFCKRCSCCICFQYDENKDPSLWLFCSSEPPFQGKSCSLSCHLECAFRNAKSGIGKDGRQAVLDGSFYCVSCGKINDLLGCWRKQLSIAKETRRVDILCYRLSLSQKLLTGTTKFQMLHEIVEEAVKKLEEELGPLTGLPVKTARGIVNRLAAGSEVQRLCSCGVDSLDMIISKTALRPSPSSLIQNSVPPSTIRFEDVASTSLTICLGLEDVSPIKVAGCKVWHRKADDMDYPAEPTCTLVAPNIKFTLSGLSPAANYIFKVAPLSDSRDSSIREIRMSTGSGEDKFEVMEWSQSLATNCSSLSNPSSVEDESNNIAPYNDQIDNHMDHHLAYSDVVHIVNSENLSSYAHDCLGMGKEGSAYLVTRLDEKCTKVVKTGIATCDVAEKTLPPEAQTEISNDDGSNSPVQVLTGMECVPLAGSSEAGLPVTPCKLEVSKEVAAKNGRAKTCYHDVDNMSEKGEEPLGGSSSKKRSLERQDQKFSGNGPSDKDFEYYVKVIRWLECEGHIEMNFRQKFLTWYSLRATTQEARIVKTFVDTFIEDPACLAGQLIDTFSDSISCNRSSVVPAGFCMKLWH